MKKLATIVLAGLTVVTMTSCSGSSARETETQQTKEIMDQIQYEVGMPDIQNFYEKKMAKEIIELRDDSDLVCYAYTQNRDGQFVYLGRSMGYGLPYSVQYTAPEYIARSGSSTGYAILPQADPNGLYMPQSADATWLMLIDEETAEAGIMYIEEDLTITQTKLPKRLVTEESLPEDY